MPPLTCPHCGLKNRSGSSFCNQCGARLVDDDVAPEEAAPEEAEESAPVPEAAPETSPPVAEAGEDPAPEGTDADEAPEAPEPLPADAEQERPAPEGTQPWLQPTAEERSVPAQVRLPRERLFSGFQGLLEPAQLPQAIPPTPPLPDQSIRLDGEAIRYFRSLAGSGLSLAAEVPLPVPERSSLRRHPLIFLLVGLVILAPVLLLASGADPAPHRWSGVTAAYESIAGLPEGSVVLVNWAYDPATAGEMDLLALPVVTHLLDRQSRLVAVSQLPGGLASGRRLLDQAAAEMYLTRGLIVAQEGEASMLVEAGFLPGGSTALALVGRDPARSAAPDPVTGLADDSQAVRRLSQQAPSLALVLAAQAEDVQDWLEQVQPQDGIPVIAVTSAGADLILRPYLDSGQLAGLVSGFDGAYSYQDLIPEPASRYAEQRMQLHVAAQEWAVWLVLGLLLMGNLAGLWRGPQ